MVVNGTGRMYNCRAANPVLLVILVLATETWSELGTHFNQPSFSGRRIHNRYRMGRRS
jgi:hypothetical protein